MSSELFLYLNSHRATSGKFSHTGLDPMKGKYLIENYCEFFEIYERSLLAGHRMAITECHEDIGPVIIDIDFRFPIDSGLVRKYTTDDIKSIIRNYNNQISQYLSCDEVELQAYVFEKPGPSKYNGNIKDGIHIMYPHIICSLDTQHEIRENIVQSITLEHLHLKNSIEDVFDEAVISKNNWFIYGGSKPEQSAYVITRVFDHNLNHCEIPEKKDLPKLLSIRNHKKSLKAKVQLRPKKEISQRQQPIIYTSINVEIAKNLTNLLSGERAESYQSWLDVGMCLFNIDNSLLNSWIEFSKQSPSFRNGECEKKWKTFKNKGFTIGSLYRWAKIDSPDEYAQLKKSEIHKTIQESLTCTNADVAKVIYEMYKYEYICASIKNTAWYEFKNHRWHELDKGLNLRKKISVELAMEYMKLSNWYKKQMLDCSADQLDQLKFKHKQCEHCLTAVKTTSFKDKVMRELEELFYDSSFINKLDSNFDLLGFENGVYDLEKGCFRDGNPDDFISFSTGIEFVEYEEDERTRNMMKVLKQIFPDNEERKYMLIIMSSYLHGRVTGHFHIWTGSGANGKSSIVDLIEMTFGDYCGKLPVSILTQKRSAAGTATPELIKTKGKRFISMQEPESGDRINVGLMKEYTGGDRLQGRGLYLGTVDFINQSKYVLMCNDLPHVPSNDGGTWRRLRVVPFKAKFVDNPDPEVEYEYKKDYTLKETMKNWVEPFMSLLLKFYKQYKPYRAGSSIVKEPDAVIQYTRKYEQESCTFLEYFKECIEITEDRNDKINLKDIFEHFKNWYTEGYGAKGPSKKELRLYLESKFEITRQGYRRLKFIGARDEDDDI